MERHIYKVNTWTTRDHLFQLQNAHLRINSKHLQAACAAATKIQAKKEDSSDDHKHYKLTDRPIDGVGSLHPMHNVALNKNNASVQKMFINF